MPGGPRETSIVVPNKIPSRSSSSVCRQRYLCSVSGLLQEHPWSVFVPASAEFFKIPHMVPWASSNASSVALDTDLHLTVT